MHSDPAEVRKSVRSYITVFVMLMVFTVITVGVSRFHFAVPLAIAIALIIAAMKGSMVGAAEGPDPWGWSNGEGGDHN